MTGFLGQSDEQLKASLKAAKRLLAVQEARENLLTFTRLTMPDPEDIDDPDLSLYEVTPQGRLLCQIIERVERGELKRVAVSIGPQLGKSEVLTRRGPAWIVGRKPSRNLIVGSYNQDFVSEFGNDVGNILASPVYRQIFPDVALQKDAVDYKVTTRGGKMSFVGVGGSGTGKPADFFLVDDPIRNDDDAQSEIYRERLWSWFNKVALTRCHKGSGIVVVHTRWHEDDLIGRLCDPDHPERHKKYKGIADRWLYINIPAVIDDPKLAKALGLTLEPPTSPFVISMFGAKPMAALWEGRKDLEFLAEARLSDPRGFDALYMGKPAPDDGAYFTADMIVEYDSHELPRNLRTYGASDHAVTEKQVNDPNVIGCVGIDEHDDIWVLPDLVWEHMETDRVVEEMLASMRRNSPLLWWMESELISKSFGPFLRKRMIEEGVYVMIDPVVPSRDKRARARAIQGRMAMRKVRFPRFAPWWPQARSQLLKFPFATHDDFVDWLAHIGMGLTKEYAAEPEKPKNEKIIRVGSIEWVKAASRARRRREQLQRAIAGF